MGQQLPVMESFLTLQGEGRHQGRLAWFIRLAGCDVGCHWCDVKDSWNISENQYRTIDSLLAEIGESETTTVVITGGEPLMHDLNELTAALQAAKYKVHLETSGAYPLSGNFDWICLSPKKFKATLPEVSAKAHELKVIINNKHDFTFGEDEARKVDPTCELYLQAEWSKRESHYPSIYSYIATHPKWKISVQSHKYLGLP